MSFFHHDETEHGTDDMETVECKMNMAVSVLMMLCIKV